MTAKTFKVRKDKDPSKDTGSGMKLDGKNGIKERFVSNAQNVAMNLARLEQAGVVDKGSTIHITGTEVKAVWPNGESFIIETFAKGDYRKRTYEISE